MGLMLCAGTEVLIAGAGSWLGSEREFAGPVARVLCAGDESTLIAGSGSSLESLGVLVDAMLLVLSAGEEEMLIADSDGWLASEDEPMEITLLALEGEEESSVADSDGWLESESELAVIMLPALVKEETPVPVSDSMLTSVGVLMDAIVLMLAGEEEMLVAVSGNRPSVGELVGDMALLSPALETLTTSTSS